MHARHDNGPVRVVLVEDSLGDAVLIEEMLREDKSSRLEFAHFERLSDAREHLISEGADCVLLDLSLPDADGLNGLLQLLSGAADVPVVILTGTADEGLAMRALEEGAQDYLVKGRADRETVMRSVRYAIERKRAEGELAYQAFHDSLTGLPNRGLFLDRLGLALVRIARHSDLLAVMFLDLDDFKYVNDSLGHGAGDELLVKIADRLSTTIRPSDTVARFGGDEFVLLCEELTQRDEATAIAERAQRALADPLFVAGQEIVASASIGIALTQDPRTSPDVLLRDADAAMYQAKGDGKARCVVFEAGRHPDDRKRLSLDSGLHHAIEREQLDLAWQPIWDLSEGRPIGAEGLLRWGHPQRGELAPDEFLHIAEERGQIVPIGYWVLSEACRQGREWAERLPGAAPMVCVNLSVRQLEDPHLVERLAASLADTGFPPDRLCVEVTEQALLGTGADTDRTLLSLRDLGVHLAVDDFGMGHSSLHTVKRAQVDILKIDRSFVAGLGRDIQDGAICKAMISLGAELGIQVVAEGIETELQLERLQELGCELGQGFHLARPAAAADVDFDGRLVPASKEA